MKIKTNIRGGYSCAELRPPGGCNKPGLDETE